MTPSVALRVPAEGLEAMQDTMPAMHDLAAAFLSAIQPRQERALHAAVQAAMWCAATHGHAPDVGRAREAFLAAWNADAGREDSDEL